MDVLAWVIGGAGVSVLAYALGRYQAEQVHEGVVRIIVRRERQTAEALNNLLLAVLSDTNRLTPEMRTRLKRAIPDTEARASSDDLHVSIPPDDLLTASERAEKALHQINAPDLFKRREAAMIADQKRTDAQRGSMPTVPALK